MTRLTPHSLHSGTEASVTPHSHKKKICDNTSVWDLLPVSEISHVMLAELCILVPWIGWKFFWNRSVKQNINWQSISYKINIHLCLFYILFFNGYQVPIFIMDFIKSFTVSTIWGRTAQKCGCFFITFYSVLHIKLLGGNSILSPVYIGRIINR